MVPSSSVDLDEMYKIAADERRRHLIGMLLATNAALSVEEASRRLRKRESTDTGDDDGAVETELYHCHLPLLHNAGFVEFDRERGVVRPRREIRSFEAILPDSEEGRERNRSDSAP